MFSLYVNDQKSEEALSLYSTLPLPLTPFTLLHRVELQNALSRRVFQKILAAADAEAAWQAMKADNAVFSHGVDLDWQEVMREAERLSATHTLTCRARSLDVIHVAAALKLGARDFISFDKRQRELAGLAGLNVLPAAF